MNRYLSKIEIIFENTFAFDKWSGWVRFTKKAGKKSNDTDPLRP